MLHQSIKQISVKTNNLVLTRKSKEIATNFKLVVKDINFDSHINQKIPFVGISGSGKSTLLEALATMLMPASGSIEWSFSYDKTIPKIFTWAANNPLSEQDKILLRTQYFGFSFQDSTLTAFFTVMDNLIYPQMVAKKSYDIAKQYALSLLKNVFNNDAINISKKYPAELSGGQRQRVALLQAMVNDPFVLFADEPTGNLDADTRNRVMSVINQWQKNTGGMFIWVTHHESDKLNVNKYLEITKTGNVNIINH